jgi:hypothetical protein
MHRFASVLLGLVLLFGAGFPVAGDPPRPELTAVPGLHRGPCPATITFRAQILPPPLPGPVRYKFVRSDGSQSPLQEVRFTNLRKKEVSTTWTIGRDYVGWVQLVITFPGNVTSNRAHFRVECQSPPRDDGGQAGGDDEDSGPQGAAPPRFFIDLRDAYLVFEPAGDTLQVAAQGSVLAYGRSWNKVQLKPYLYHLRRNDWRDFFWQVNTSRREALMIRGGEFGTITEGTRQKLEIVVEPVGRGGELRPERVLLRFGSAYLVHVPGEETLQIIGAGAVLSRGEDWSVCRLKPYLYHLRQANWRDFFFQVNTSRRQIWKVEDGVFCRLGGRKTRLDFGVRLPQ